MTKKRTLSANQILQDIRAGASDSELMHKYTLTKVGLERAFAKLVEAGLLQEGEVDARRKDSSSESEASSRMDENDLAVQPEKKRKWFESPFIVWLTLFACFPVGLVLLWISSGFRVRTKVAVTLVVVCITVLAVALHEKKPAEETALTTKSEPVPSSPPVAPVKAAPKEEWKHFKDGLTVNQYLQLAAGSNDIDAAKLAIENGADVNCCKDHGDGTPLMHASFLGHVEMVKLLLAAGAVVNARTTHVGDTALHRAVAQCFVPNKLKVTELLLEAGADLHVLDSNDIPPWGKAYLMPVQFWKPCKPMRMLLLKYSNQQGLFKYTKGEPFKPKDSGSWAKVYQDTVGNMGFRYETRRSGSDLEEFRAAVAAGADVSGCAKCGHGTWLMVATFYHAPDAVEFLLEAGADVNSQQEHLGWTALHYAAHSCNNREEDVLPIARMILMKGARLTIKDKQGFTPIDWARYSQCPKLQRLFEDYR